MKDVFITVNMNCGNVNEAADIKVGKETMQLLIDRLNEKCVSIITQDEVAMNTVNNWTASIAEDLTRFLQKIYYESMFEGV
jgi:hypothetical protein